jgi:general secretion pathway protein K
VALITALVILAIAATLSAAMIWQGGLDERRSATLIQGNQAMEYALGAESWAEQILIRDFKQPQSSGGNSVNLGQDWAQQLPPLPVEGGQIIGHIEDMQGRFNLDLLQAQNGTAPLAYKAQFGRLLTALSVDQITANAIADSVADWVNSGTIPTQPDGAKDDFYSRLQPAYLTALAPMTSASELELVKGMTPQIYAALLPYVCAIPLSNGSTNSPSNGSAAPGGWALNVNTALPLLLTTLAPSISEDQAAQVVAARASQGISQSDFNNIIKLAPSGGVNGAAGPPATGITSKYFLLTVTVEIGSTHVTMYSLLYSSGANVSAVRRTFGTL